MSERYKNEGRVWREGGAKGPCLLLHGSFRTLHGTQGSSAQGRQQPHSHTASSSPFTSLSASPTPNGQSTLLEFPHICSPIPQAQRSLILHQLLLPLSQMFFIIRTVYLLLTLAFLEQTGYIYSVCIQSAIVLADILVYMYYTDGLGKWPNG